eukprot:4904100-Alexandrium_andersonii.AAC.1
MAWWAGCQLAGPASAASTPQCMCDPAGAGLLDKVGGQAVFAPGEAGVGGRRCGKSGANRCARTAATM